MTSQSRIHLSVLLVALGATALPARADNVPPAVEAAETEWYAALMAADGARIDKLLDKDFHYQHPTGNTYDEKQIIDLFASKQVTVSKIGPVERSYRVLDETVIAFGSNQIEGMLNGQAYAGTIRFVDVWQNQAGAWQLIHRNSEILPSK
jgi:ketosteroid isomerase-like protein